jgi:hypothetical protein
MSTRTQQNQHGAVLVSEGFGAYVNNIGPDGTIYTTHNADDAKEFAACYTLEELNRLAVAYKLIIDEADPA